MEMIAIFIEMACVGECASVIFQKMPVKTRIPVTVMDAINPLQPFQFFDTAILEKQDGDRFLNRGDDFRFS